MRPLEKGPLPFFLQSSTIYRFARKRGVASIGQTGPAARGGRGSRSGSGGGDRSSLPTAAQEAWGAGLRAPPRPRRDGRRAARESGSRVAPTAASRSRTRGG